MKRRLVLFSGMGGDRRLYRDVKLPEFDVVTPNHAEVERGEDMTRYAARLAEAHRIGPDDVVGGISFGGMIAGAMTAQRKTAGLILLGSTIRPKLLPDSYRWLEKAGPLIPDFALDLRTTRPMLRWRFAPLTREAEDCLRAMAADCPPNQIRDFGRLLFGWAGVERLSCPMLSVHGGRDRIIPLGAAEKGLVLKDAGHAFTLTHGGETSEAIRRFVCAL